MTVEAALALVVAVAVATMTVEAALAVVMALAVALAVLSPPSDAAPVEGIREVTLISFSVRKRVWEVEGPY